MYINKIAGISSFFYKTYKTNINVYKVLKHNNNETRRTDIVCEREKQEKEHETVDVTIKSKISNHQKLNLTFQYIDNGKRFKIILRNLISLMQLDP